MLLAFLLASGTIYFFMPILLSQLVFAIWEDGIEI